MPEPSDLQLVDACRNGDEEAWADLVGRYAALIASVPRRYGMSEDLVEEVFSEVCVILVRSLAGVRDAQALPLWIIRTTTRATWEVSRKHRRALPADLPELTGSAPPEEFVAALEEEEAVRRALRRLSEKCRRLLHLLYFDARDPSYDEIARTLKVPRGSLGPTRRRCLDRMRDQLPAHLGGDAVQA